MTEVLEMSLREETRVMFSVCSEMRQAMSPAHCQGRLFIWGTEDEQRETEPGPAWQWNR